MGCSFQNMENEQAKSYFNMDHNDTGIMINYIPKLSNAYSLLKVQDIILSVDGIKVGDDGTIAFPNRNTGERLSVSYLWGQKDIIDSIQLEILRSHNTNSINGKNDIKVKNSDNIQKLQITINLTKRKVIDLVPLHLYDKPTDYCIFAGLVFIALSWPYIQEEIKRGIITPSFLYNAQDEEKMLYNEEIVIIGNILSSNINHGYESAIQKKLVSIDNIKVINLKHAYSLLHSIKIKYKNNNMIRYVRIELQNGNRSLRRQESSILFINYNDAMNDEGIILKQNGIASSYSFDSNK